MATKSVSDAERIAIGLHVFQYKSMYVWVDYRFDKKIFGEIVQLLGGL